MPVCVPVAAHPEPPVTQHSHGQKIACTEHFLSFYTFLLLCLNFKDDCIIIFSNFKFSSCHNQLLQNTETKTLPTIKVKMYFTLFGVRHPCLITFSTFLLEVSYHHMIVFCNIFLIQINILGDINDIC